MKTVYKRLKPKIYALYIQRGALRGFLMAQVALTGLFTLLTFVSELASVGTGHYGVADALLYALLLSPQKAIEVSPIALMLGCLLSLGAMARNSELTAFLAAGISELRIIRAAMRVIVPISIVLVLTSQFIVPPARSFADAHRSLALEKHGEDSAIWVTRGGEYLHVQAISASDEPRGIDIFRFNTSDALTAYIHADAAVILPGGTWELQNVTLKQIHSEMFVTQKLPTLRWASITTPEEMRLLTQPPSALSATALLHYIRLRRALGDPAPLYEGEFWTRTAIPASMVALVMLAAPFLFNLSRSGSTGARIGVGVVIAILYSLFQQVISRLGLVTDIPLMITALGPPVALILFGAWLIVEARQ
jgi:lipopolysaccharide export system permease protein